MVENGFSSGNDVIVVAGFSADDTVRASRALASGNFSGVRTSIDGYLNFFILAEVIFWL